MRHTPMQHPVLQPPRSGSDDPSGPRSGRSRASTRRVPITGRLAPRAARLRLLLTRRPRLYWVGALTCATAAALVVARATAEVTSARAAWGQTRTVVVARTAGAAGEQVDVELRTLPIALLPDEALTAVPPGVVAAHDVSRGEVLTTHDLVDPAVAEGVRIAVPARGAPDLTVGQTAVLLTVDGTRCEGPVVARDDEWLDVAVPERCTTSVALAVLAGDLVVAAAGS